MQKFLIRFLATIVESKRLENDPDKYYINDIYETQDDRHLAKLINDRFMELTTNRGLTVFKDGGFNIMPPGTGNIEKRVFIPWHMIAKFEASVSPITEVYPESEQDLLSEPDLAKVEGPAN